MILFKCFNVSRSVHSVVEQQVDVGAGWSALSGLGWPSWLVGQFSLAIDSAENRRGCLSQAITIELQTYMYVYIFTYFYSNLFSKYSQQKKKIRLYMPCGVMAQCLNTVAS